MPDNLLSRGQSCVTICGAENAQRCEIPAEKAESSGTNSQYRQVDSIRGQQNLILEASIESSPRLT